MVGKIMGINMKIRTLSITVMLLCFLFVGCSKFSAPKDFETIQGKSFEGTGILPFSFHFSNFYVRDEGKTDIAYFIAPSLDAMVNGLLEIRNYSPSNYSGKLIINEMLNYDNQSTKYEWIERRFDLIDKDGNNILDQDGKNIRERIKLYPKDSIDFEIMYDNEIKENIMIVTFENGTRSVFTQKD